MGCSGTFSDQFTVHLEFSTDMGYSWRPVVEACLPPKLDCVNYVLESTYSSESFSNWTRVTLYLPAKAMLVFKRDTKRHHIDIMCVDPMDVGSTHMISI